MVFYCCFALDGCRRGFCVGNLWNVCLVLCRAATTTRKAWESRFEQLESLESGKAEQKASAEVKKEQASSKLDRLREKLGKIEEKLRQLREKERMAEKNASIGEGGDVSDPSPDDTMDTNQHVSSPEDGTNSDDYIPVDMPTPVGSAEEGDETHEETEEERAKRIASQWIPGANHEDGEENQDEEAPSDNDEPYEDENAMQEGSADYEFENGEPVVPDEPGVPQPDDHYPEGSPHVELNLFQKCRLLSQIMDCRLVFKSLLIRTWFLVSNKMQSNSGLLASLEE